ncbi:MAG: XdhC family protein [Alicyclobacillaceae bacterium]|nr:XdhC family protein [Alicyclobacillaceae bacterium]
MDHLWETARDLDERAEPYVMVTVVRRVRPSSATVGDKAIVTADGTMKGFVGGHCTRELVIGQAQDCLRSGESKLVLVTSRPPGEVAEGVTVLPMTCASEGTVELFLEPKNVEPLLLVVGNSPIAFALEEWASRFSLRPRRISLEEAASTGSAADDPLEKLRRQLPVHAKTAVYGVVATMGVYDVEGLLALSALPLRYLGVVTSPKRWRTVRAGLEEGGAPSAFIDFITAPAGLNIGAVGPEEIALSILAQIVERRRRGVGEGWEGQSAEEIPVSGGSDAPAGDRGAHGQVIDPVCGMTVDLATTPYRLEWEGTVYGFCCPGCRNRFARDPHAYVQNRA